MSKDEILFEIGDDGIAWLTFNRPEARNAMTFGMYQRLGEICRAPDPRMKVLILRGAGDKAFVSGTDIAQFRAFNTPKHALDYEATMDAVFDALEDVPVPTIAAIQGACTGGGAGIAAACDLRLGAPSAKFGFPIARTLGNTLSMRNHARLAALIGVARTKDILFLARLMDAQEMRAIGLLNEITTEQGLHTRANGKQELIVELLEGIARDEAPDRPDRTKPRAVKRRPKAASAGNTCFPHRRAPPCNCDRRWFAAGLLQDSK